MLEADLTQAELDLQAYLSAGGPGQQCLDFLGAIGVPLSSAMQFDFSGANLLGVAADFDQVDFTNATYSASTTFAAGFGAPAARGMIFVPEPATGALLGAALSALAWVRRR